MSLIEQSAKTNILNISVEDNLVISRYNGEGSGSVVCGFESNKQVQKIIDNHNDCEKMNPSIRNATAVLTINQ